MPPFDVNSATLAYTVDGMAESKSITRFSLKNDNYNGSYYGAYKITATGCSNASYDGTQFVASTFTVTQASGTFQVKATDTSGDYCTYNGSYQQHGQFGQSSGTYTCTSGELGNCILFEMNVNIGDMCGRISATNNLGCSITGNFAALMQ